MNQIIECIPNFSEGRNLLIIRDISDAINNVPGIKLLDVSSGRATNRTVMTFAGEPEAVVEAAFRGIQKAAQLIDMRKHIGEHPRFGATDVCPLVPVANISMEETVRYARALSERVGNELKIPVYCYEYAAFEEERRSLANCRMGGYEGLKKKLSSERWKPDFFSDGWSENVAKTGAIAIGARNFLIAFNVNINTTSSSLAQSIALDIRESGRLKREGNSDYGAVITDDEGKPERIPGSLKKVRALGWFIEEFGIAQVSMNLTDISVTSVHQAFEEVAKKADLLGVRVTGSELVGLVPLQSMIDAGKYYLYRQKQSTGISDDEIIKIAIRSLGLDELQPFDPKKKIIEYILKEEEEEKLSEKTISRFVTDAASESRAPGGGSVAAAMGAMGTAMGGMVANLSIRKKGWGYRWQEFSDYADKAKEYYKLMLNLIDQDAVVFKKLFYALNLPDNDDQEAIISVETVSEASKGAMEVPFKVIDVGMKALLLIRELIDKCNPALLSDAAVGAVAIRAAIESSLLNMKINAVHCEDVNYRESLIQQAELLVASAKKTESEILDDVDKKIKEMNGQK
jgi:glutamate formiminotransferase / formiminotetrahydrofolate cyclodeaminase